MNFRQRLVDRMRAAEESRLYDMLYRDPVTGVLNRRALDGTMSPAVALVDVDSLKWVNDELGHRAGDAELRHTATALVLAFGEPYVFRAGGDEFAIRGSSAAELLTALWDLQDNGARFSVGAGRTLAEADEMLRRNKRWREAAGLRAPRGEPPPWRDQVKAALSTRR